MTRRDPDDTSTGRTIPPSTRAWTDHLVHVIDPNGRDITSWRCGPGDHRLIRGCGPADAPPPDLPLCAGCVGGT